MIVCRLLADGGEPDLFRAIAGACGANQTRRARLFDGFGD